ncbi:molybdopterin-guanine dinucleotide biosynthesis [Listeria monocytogenes]|nr:molybdopterin-guanine dinucleotide biosynthesis [Listeria monocytogenes]GAT39506.1 molybdopterin-guanine dinucleotide biosynthesis [Listeria monocytogenes]
MLQSYIFHFKNSLINVSAKRVKAFSSPMKIASFFNAGLCVAILWTALLLFKSSISACSRIKIILGKGPSL